MKKINRPTPVTDGEVAEFISLLADRGLTVGAAESCTAGMISSRIADIPGSSDVLAGGVVSYSNDVKRAVLGVREETLRNFGAVSEECAREMAEGALRVIGCSVAVSVTGIAGPGGGTAEKPVGTVCFGVADKDGTVTATRRFGEHSDRATVRRLTVAEALRLVTDRVTGII
ncbi:MAG: CinA family protein [Clostridia bacterium]|nr:CinA family protein [Clostridia bacterium]